MFPLGHSGCAYLYNLRVPCTVCFSWLTAIPHQYYLCYAASLFAAAT